MRASSWHRRLPARPPGCAADRPDRRLGPSHRRAGPAAETRPRRRRTVCDAARPGCGARRVRPRPASRSTTSTASRCTTASRRASTSPSTTSGSPVPANRGRPSRTARSRTAGALPINPSGGLIGGGHPVGASGVRMLLDAAKQVSDGAGDYQVEGAKTFGTLNFGGSTATTVSFVVGSAKESEMDVEIVGKFLSTLPEDDDHPYRTGSVAAADHRMGRRRPHRRRGRNPARPGRRLSAQHREPAASRR